MISRADPLLLREDGLASGEFSGEGNDKLTFFRRL
jgi:hypothetical protein